MANDLSRDLKVNISVATTGISQSALDALAASMGQIGVAFAEINKVSSSASSKVDSLVASINQFSKIKKPAGLDQITTSVKELASYGKTMSGMATAVDLSASLKKTTAAATAASTAITNIIPDTFVKKVYSTKALLNDLGTSTKKSTVSFSELTAVSKTLGSSFSGASSAVAKYTSTFSSALTSTNVYKSSVDSFKSSMTGYVTALDSANRANIAYKASLSSIAAGAVKASKETANLWIKQTQLDQALQKTVGSATKAAKLKVKLAEVTKQTAAEYDKVNAAIKRNKVAVDKYVVSLTELGKRFKTVATFRIISSVLQTINSTFTEGVAAIIDYDQSLKDLQAITLATADDVEIMGAAIRKTSSDTKFLVTEVAAGMKLLAQAGLTTAEASAAIGDVANLATGTLSDMASTVDLVTTAMRVFDIQATDSERIVDGFANAVNRSKLTIDKIRTSFNYVGPVAKEAGISFEETQASLMSLANSGLRASTMGTGLRRILAELAAPSKKFEDAAMQAGVAMELLNPNTNDFSVVLKNLGLVLKDTEAAFDIFGKRGAAAALALTSSTSGYDNLLGTVSKTGTAAKQAAIQMEGLDVAFKKVTGKAQLLMVAVGDAGLTKILYGLAIAFQKTLDGLRWFAESGFGTLVMQATAAAAALTLVVVALNSIKLSLAALSLISAAATKAGVSLISLTGIVGKLRLAMLSLNVSLGVFAAAAAAIILLVVAYKKISKAAEKHAKENRKLAASYAFAQQEIKSYEDQLLSLEGNAEGQSKANLKMRERLIDSSSSLGVLGDSARAAAAAIHPLTGEILDNNDALKAHFEALDTQKYKAMQAAALSMEKQFMKLEGQLNRTADASSDWDFAEEDQQKTIASVKEHIELLKTRAANGEKLSKRDKANLDTYNELLTDTTRRLQFLQETASDEFDLDLDTDELMTMFEGKFFTDPLSTAGVAFRETIETMKSAQKSALDQTEKDLSGWFNAINEFWADESNHPDTAAFWESLEDKGAEQAVIEGQIKISQELYQVYKDASDAVANLKFTPGTDKAQFAEEYRALLVTQEKALEDLTRQRSAYMSDPESLRFDLLLVAESKYITQRKALKEQDFKSAEGMATALLELDNKYAAEKLSIQTRASAAEQALLVKASTAASTDYEVANKKRAEDATKNLTAAREQDALISVKNAELGAKGISVTRAKIENSEKRKAALIKELEAQEKLRKSYEASIVQRPGEEDEAYNKRKKAALDIDKEYQKIQTKTISIQKKIKKTTSSIVELSKIETKYTQAATDAWAEYNDELKETKDAKDDIDFDADIEAIENSGEAALAMLELRIKKEEEYYQKKRRSIKQDQADVGVDIAATTLELEDEDDSAKIDILNKQLAESYALQEQHKRDLLQLDSDYDITSLDRSREKADEELAIMAMKYKAGIIGYQAYLDALNKGGTSMKFGEKAKLQLDIATQAFRDGKLGPDEYTKAVEAAAAAYVELTKAQLLGATGNVWENFTFGAREALGDVKTLGEEMQALGAVAAESIASGMTENIQAFADGTKSASEAFSDFIKGFLEDIAKAILQALVLKAVQTAFGGGGDVSAANGGSINKADGGWARFSYADGGVAGIQGGGMIRGYSPHHKADNIKANLTAGEYVIPVRAVDKLREGGDWILESLRRGILPQAQYATGGLVRGISSLGNVTNSLPNYNLGGIVRAQSFTQSLADGGMVQDSDSNVGQPAVNVQADSHYNVTNVVDVGATNKAWLDSVQGEKSLINFISTNQSAIKGILR